MTPPTPKNPFYPAKIGSMMPHKAHFRDVMTSGRRENLYWSLWAYFLTDLLHIWWKLTYDLDASNYVKKTS